MQSTSHLLFNQETRYGFTIHERTLDWNGPYKVVEQTSRGTYRLQNEQGKLLKQAVSSNHLKHYVESEFRSEEEEERKEEQTMGGKTQKQQDRKRMRM